MSVERRGAGVRLLQRIARGFSWFRMTFRRFRRTRPFWAGFWCMLGGFILAYVPGHAFKLLFAPATLLWAGVLVGVLVGVMGLFLWIQPQLRYILGVVIILLSLLSFITSDFGGFFIGMLLGIIGGSLAMAWMPNPPLSRRERRREGRTAEVVVRSEEAQADAGTAETGSTAVEAG